MVFRLSGLAALLLLALAPLAAVETTPAASQPAASPAAGNESAAAGGENSATTEEPPGDDGQVTGSGTSDSQNSARVIVREIPTRQYRLRFLFGTQLSQGYPLFNWQLAWTSTWLKDLSYQANLENFYGSEPSSFLYSPDFFTADVLARYNYRWFFGRLGPRLTARSFAFSESLSENLGVSPLITAGVFYEGLLGLLNFELGLSYIGYSDGFWLTVDPLMCVTLRERFAMLAGYSFRYSYASEGDRIRDNTAGILRIGVRFTW